jgi:hypothetical protein
MLLDSSKLIFRVLGEKHESGGKEKIRQDERMLDRADI